VNKDDVCPDDRPPAVQVAGQCAASLPPGRYHQEITFTILEHSKEGVRIKVTGLKTKILEAES
jgi:hypothetical protein